MQSAALVGRALKGQKESVQKLLVEVQSALDCAKSISANWSSVNGVTLWHMYQPLFKICQLILDMCEINLPSKKRVVAEFTDAGPGVGVSNFEVRFRMAEISQMHKTERRTRLHRATGDSAQNESERTNGCIGEALADGGALQWEYFSPQDTHTKEEIDAMTLDELKTEEASCMKKNAWRVCQDVHVSERIHMEQGPAGDMMLAMVEDETLFFYNNRELVTYQKASKSNRKGLPGYHYFRKIEEFIDEHFEKSELFLEYRFGNCTRDGDYNLCQFCQQYNIDGICRSPRPYPDLTQAKYKYLSLEDTPVSNRNTDDFSPRVNLKKLYNKEEIDTSNTKAVQEFSNNFIVDEQHVLTYLAHLEYLELKRKKRIEKRKELLTMLQMLTVEMRMMKTKTTQKQDEKQKTHDNNDNYYNMITSTKTTTQTYDEMQLDS